MITAALSSPRKDVDMQQDDDGSAPMRGSQPVAWAVHIDDSACAFPDSRPLRRPRLLTNDEEEAIRGALGWLLWCYQNSHLGDAGRKDIAALRGLLERLA